MLSPDQLKTISMQIPIGTRANNHFHIIVQLNQIFQSCVNATFNNLIMNSCSYENVVHT